MSESHQKITDLLIAGNAAGLRKAIEQALNEGSAAGELLESALLPGMDTVGQRMKTGEMFIPEVLRAAQAMQGGLDLIVPLLGNGTSATFGTFVLGTVEGDLHDIGKNLVGMMLKGSGFKVIDLGINVSQEAFAKAVEENNADIVGMSALLTTTMPKMRATVEYLQQKAVRDRVKLMVGGAPVSQQFAEEIGADAYGYNAADAVEKAKKLMTKQ